MKYGKILVVHGEGLGNIVEVLPLLKTLRRVASAVDVLLLNCSFPVPRDFFSGSRIFLPGDTLPAGEYDGKVLTIWGVVHGKDMLKDIKTLNDPAKQRMRLDRSEVDVYLDAARDMGIREPFEFDCSDVLKWEEPKEEFDVVISDGCNWKMGDLWSAKRYPRHAEVAKRLRLGGFSVCSVGSACEFVANTADRTGLALPKTLGLLKKAKVVVSNDSGLYHCACAFDVPVVVVFTFTSVRKNYDERFHRTATVVRRKGVACMSTCHANMMWKRCKSGEICRKVPVKDVVAAAGKYL